MLTVNGAAITSTFDDATRLVTNGTRSYAYDDNGNFTGVTDGGFTTSYA